MLLIIAHHFSVHTGLVFDADQLSFNRLWYEFLYSGGKIGVNVFILITGYFSFRNMTLKMGKVFQFYLQTFFYSVVIFVIFAVFNLPTGDNGAFRLTWKTLLENIFPITTLRWWFTSTYFVLIIFSPFINLFIASISRTGLKLVLLIIGFFYTIIPSIYIESNFFTAAWNINQVIWFVFLYLLSAYYGKYGFRFDIKASKLILISLGVVILTFGTVIIFDLLGKSNLWFISDHKNQYYYEMQTLPILVASVCLFEGFLKLDIGSNKIINTISSVTFGIYLIHDNMLFRELMWKNGVRDTLLTKCLNAPNVESVKHFVPISISIIIAVFVICGLIEVVRLYLIEPLYIKNFFKWGKRLDDKVDDYIRKEGLVP